MTAAQRKPAFITPARRSTSPVLAAMDDQNPKLRERMTRSGCEADRAAAARAAKRAKPQEAA